VTHQTTQLNRIGFDDIHTPVLSSALDEVGYVYVDGIPESFDHAGFLRTRLGPLLPQYDGETVWSIRPDQRFEGTYHSLNSRRLTPHTECYEWQDAPPKYLALWCLVPQDDWEFPNELRQRYVAARKMIGMLPVGTRPGDPVPRTSFFWSVRSDGFDAWERAGLEPWLDEIRDLWPQAHARMTSVTTAAQLRRATYRDAVLDVWGRGRLVLLGDAAHAMSPQLGQGVNMALMDALALRDALRAETTTEAALARYQHQRRSHVHIYQFWSRWLTPLFQSERNAAARVRDLTFLPLGRMPGGRGQMLRVLSGLQRGWFGRLQLPPTFLDRLGKLQNTGPSRSA